MPHDGHIHLMHRDSHLKTKRSHKPHLMGSKASVLQVLVPRLGKWKGGVRKGMCHKICAKSNIWILW